MEPTYKSNVKAFTYRQRYMSVSWRHVLEDVCNASTDYLIGIDCRQFDRATTFILANSKMFNVHSDGQKAYQIWVVAFEVDKYRPEYRVDDDGVAHYHGVNTEYRMIYKMKSWQTDGVSMPSFDHIQTPDEVAGLFLEALAAARLSPVRGGGLAFTMDERIARLEDYKKEFFGTLRLSPPRA